MFSLGHYIQNMYPIFRSRSPLCLSETGDGKKVSCAVSVMRRRAVLRRAYRAQDIEFPGRKQITLYVCISLEIGIIYRAQANSEIRASG